MPYIRYEDLENSIEKEFGSKKKYVIQLSKIFDKICCPESAKRVGCCGDWLEYNRFDDNTYTLHHANFCFNKLCPICNRRRSLKLFNQVLNVVDVLQCQYDFLFVTLTVRNCDENNLSKTVDEMFKAFSTRFLRYKKIHNAFAGCFKSFEVTVDNQAYITRDMYFGNAKKHLKSRKGYYDKLGLRVGDKNPNFLMYHPHFHLIVAVPKGYVNSADYISQDDICCLWKKAMRLNYKPICDIRCITNKSKTISRDFCAAVAEVAKYSVKASDYLSSNSYNINCSIVKCLNNVLSCRQLFAFYGVFADIRQALKYKDVEIDKNLVDVDNDSVKEVKQLTHIVYYRYSYRCKRYYNYHTYAVDYAYITALKCHDKSCIDIVVDDVV